MARGDLTWFKGSHSIDAGFFTMRGSFDRISQYSNGGFALEEQHAVDPNNPSLGTIPFHRQYVTPDSVTGIASVDRDIGIYLQDSWKPMSRLTVNAGIRADFVNRHDDVFNIDRLNSVGVAPRLGFSLLLTDDATTVLRGSYGRFYEQLVGYDGVTLFGASARVSTRDEYSTDGFQTVSSVVESPAVKAEIADYQIDPNLSEPFVDEFIVGVRKQFPGEFAVDVSTVHRVFRNGFGLVDVNGIYPDGPNQPFIGFGRIDSNRGILSQETNNTWAQTKYTSIEVTATKNLSNNLQFAAGFHRQWQHLSGTWNPTDPARFIQPDAFPNNKWPWGTFWNNDSNSLAETGASISYAPMWRPYSARLAGNWFAPGGIVVAASYTLNGGPYNGHVLELLPADDPGLAVFGPPTVVSSTGVSQPNPLATRVRFAFPTRSEGQTEAPGISIVGVKIGKTFRLSESGEIEVAGNIFNLLNAGGFYRYSYNGPNRIFSPGYLELEGRQAARGFQLSLTFRWQ